MAACSRLALLVQTLGPSTLDGQTLLNVDFGVGHQSPKTGFAATGQSTNDFWNLYRHYDPKFVPGTRLVHDGELKNLKLADGTDTKIFLTVSNAPGVWGNASGDAMYDTYVFANNGSNLTVTVSGTWTWDKRVPTGSQLDCNDTRIGVGYAVGWGDNTANPLKPKNSSESSTSAMPTTTGCTR